MYVGCWGCLIVLFVCYISSFIRFDVLLLWWLLVSYLCLFLSLTLWFNVDGCLCA